MIKLLPYEIVLYISRESLEILYPIKGNFGIVESITLENSPNMICKRDVLLDEGYIK